MEAAAPRHPIQLLVDDDLRRSRLTVFFRLLLALPHLLWLGLWSSVVFVVVVLSWFATLAKGSSPRGLHDFLAAYLRYAIQVEAYVLLVANPFPGFFLGSARPYPIDLEIDPPLPQSRWKTAFRLVLAIPALMLAGAFTGGAAGSGFLRTFGLSGTAAFLTWFAALVRGQAPRGLRDASAWSLGYGAQAGAYLLLLTDSYPYTGPEGHLGRLDAPIAEGRPTLVNEDDLRRSRLTVFFRLPLAFPHLVWFLGWYLLAVFAWLLNWFVTLALGRSARPLARFLSAFIRYSVHLQAFLYLVANPFPGFTGRAGSYPVDVRIEPFGRQGRWVTLGRIPFLYGLAPLILPVLLFLAALSNVLVTAAFLGWFAALARGAMPAGLQRAGAYVLGYTAQAFAYWWLLTDRYPHSSPLAVLASPPGEKTAVGTLD